MVRVLLVLGLVILGYVLKGSICLKFVPDEVTNIKPNLNRTYNVIREIITVLFHKNSVRMDGDDAGIISESEVFYGK